MNEWFVRQVEAYSLECGITDKRVRSLVQYGLATALTRRGMPQTGPQAPFDLEFFALILKSMMADQNVMRSIVSGDPDEHAWWPDE
jgi:hypothetical protein